MKKLLLMLLGLSFFFVSCGTDEDEEVYVENLEKFQTKYNQYIKKWLVEQQEIYAKKKVEIEKRLEEADEEAAGRIQAEIVEVNRDIDRIKFRQSIGNYFSYQTIEDLPENLVWEDGMEEPEIGDPRAKKGGTFRYFIPNFPATLRPIGSEANNEFRGEIYDNIDIYLVGLHPDTKRVFPGVARQWAVSEDKRTVYFKLDPDASFTDGVKVRVEDFFTGIAIRVSDNVVDPYSKQYFREQIAQIARYDEETMSITLASARPLPPYFAAIRPFPTHFYNEFGPDYEDRYAWRVPPSTGAYYVNDEDVVKGVSITMTRAKDWWAKDKKYYRYRFNPDKMRFTVIRDTSKAFELFKAGELDYFRGLILPEYWYDKSESDQFFDGFIEKHQFYHGYPHIPRGLYLNVAKGVLGDRNVREGLHHAMNFQKVIDVIFRGDYERLDQVCGGQGEFSDPSIKAREFSIVKARKAFEKAGYTEMGSDGILRKPDGSRLSVELSYPSVGFYPKAMPILKEEALKAGVEIRLAGNESTLFYQQVMKKEHEMVIWGWGVTPPYPRLYQQFHSSTARDAKGNLKQQTNNLNSYSNDEMDKYVLNIRHAKTEEEIKSNAWAAQRLAHDEALFIPAWREPFARVGCWRWMKWPDSEFTKFAPALFDRPRESYVWWIDDELKKETLEAKREGKVFEEKTKIHDAHRVKKGVSNE